MPTRFRKIAIYIASYGIDYLIVLGLSIWKKYAEWQALDGEKQDFFTQCDKGSQILWGVLLCLTVFSVIETIIISNLRMNSRIKKKPSDNATFDMLGYVVAQVLTIVAIAISDYWFIIDVVIFLITGVYYLLSGKVYTSPIFTLGMGRKVYNTEDGCIIITRMSSEDLLRAYEDEIDGIEARQIDKKVYMLKR